MCYMFYEIINDVGTRSLLTFINIYSSQDLATYSYTYVHELGHEFIQLASYIPPTDESRCVPSLISAFS